MDVHFTKKLEEYYEKCIELQEKLKNSEEQRLLLEMKFNQMLEQDKSEQHAYYRKLRMEYKKFLDEDLKRQQRNERLIRTLDRVETGISILSAKTERVNLLRRQYQNMALQGFNQTIVVDDSNSTHQCSSMKENLYKDEMEKLDRYLRNLSEAQKIKSEPNQATAIADGIINSIYTRHYGNRKSDINVTMNHQDSEQLLSSKSHNIDPNNLKTFCGLDVVNSGQPQLSENKLPEETEEILPNSKAETENEVLNINKLYQENNHQATEKDLIQTNSEVSNLELDVDASLVNDQSMEKYYKQDNSILDQKISQKINEEQDISEAKIENDQLAENNQYNDELTNEPKKDHCPISGSNEQLTPDQLISGFEQLRSHDPNDSNKKTQQDVEIDEKNTEHQEYIEPNILNTSSIPHDQLEESKEIRDENDLQYTMPDKLEVMENYDQYAQQQEGILEYEQYGEMFLYDENGQQVQPHFDENGQIIPQYDEMGQLIMLYDQYGQPYYDNQFYQQEYDEQQINYEPQTDHEQLQEQFDSKQVEYDREPIEMQNQIKEDLDVQLKEYQPEQIDQRENENEYHHIEDQEKNQEKSDHNDMEQPKNGGEQEENVQIVEEAKDQQNVNNIDEESDKDNTTEKNNDADKDENKINVMEFLNTDTDSFKQNTNSKISNDTDDFDFS